MPEQSENPSPNTQDGADLRLETPRLILRHWTAGDIPDLIEGLNDLSVSRWLALVPHPYTRDAAEAWVAYCAHLDERGRNRNDFEFAIELRSAHKAIGGVSLTRIHRGHGTAGGGIWLNSRYQGHGYGREAFAEKVRFAFEVLHLRRLDNGYFAGNDASRIMQERLGYKIEGLRRQAYRCMADGELKDECTTGLLVEEWNRHEK